MQLAAKGALDGPSGTCRCSTWLGSDAHKRRTRAFLRTVGPDQALGLAAHPRHLQFETNKTGWGEVLGRLSSLRCGRALTTPHGVKAHQSEPAVPSARCSPPVD